MRYVLQNPFNSHAGTVNVHYWLCGPLKVPFRTSYRLLANGKERYCTTVLAKGKLGSDFDFALPILQPLLWYNTVGEPDYLPRQMIQTQHTTQRPSNKTKRAVPGLFYGESRNKGLIAISSTSLEDHLDMNVNQRSYMKFSSLGVKMALMRSSTFGVYPQVTIGRCLDCRHALSRSVIVLQIVFTVEIVKLAFPCGFSRN